MKRILSVVLILALMLAPCGVIAEESVSSEWAKEYVDRAMKLNWVSPQDFTKEITRGAFCHIAEQFLYSCGLDVSFWAMETPFTDIGEGFTGETGAIKYLYCLNVVEGKSETEFCPDDLITREEAAVIITRIIEAFCEWEVADITTNEEEDFLYTDYKEISSWAAEAVYDIRDLGIMKGTGTYFEPKKQLTYEEAVTMLIRLYDKRWSLEQGSLEHWSFADKLNSLMPEDKNYMFSPLSIKMALSLAANGADEETKDEIMHVLNIKDLDDFNEFSKEAIKLYLESEEVQVNVSNSVWVNKSQTSADFTTEFTDTATEYYNADTGAVTKKDAAEVINSWVREKTNNKIDSIITEGNTDFWAAVINAIYFNAKWQNEFYEGATKKDLFTQDNGEEKEIDFMNQTDWFSYADNGDCRIIELPYGKRTHLDISMYVLLSDKDVCAQNEINEANFNRTFVKLSMPKFNIEFSTSLKGMLTDMGMEKAFGFNFNKILENEPLKIDDVFHKTYIKVDEEGTEAAAVTVAMMVGTGMPQKMPEPIEFKADKPFCFVIRDNTSGEILFMGRYAYAE